MTKRELKKKRDDFKKELESVINRHSMENFSNTPDFILADYLMDCLDAFCKTANTRERWYGRNSSLWNVNSGLDAGKLKKPLSAHVVGNDVYLDKKQK